MTIYKVEYTKKDFNAYFSGAYNCYTTEEKFFTTKEKAENFVATEMKEYVPTWKREEVVKAVGNGIITEITVE